MIRDERESVAVVIKFLMSGVFCVHDFHVFQEKRVLRTFGGILVITHYEPEYIFQEQAHNK